MRLRQAESPAPLDADTIARLQQLIRINLNSAESFRQAADVVSDRALASEFRVWAADRTRQADELADFVEFDNRHIEDQAGSTDSSQACILERHEKLLEDASTILAEIERCEKNVEQKYDEVLTQVVDTPINTIIQRHFACGKRVRNRVGDLRESRRRR